MAIISEKRIATLDNLLTDGLVLEDTGLEYTKKPKKSYATPEYNQAREILKKILHRNHEIIPDEHKNKMKGQELFNLIPFIGERGTGKTSAMFSFAETLNEYDYTKHEAFLDKEQCGFIVLDPIDASVLKRHENIMLIILSRMVKYLQKVVNQNKRLEYGVPTVRQEELRELYKGFEELFQDLNSMEEEKPIPSGGSMLQKLLDLNSSYSVPERFRNLTGKFLRYLSKNQKSYGYDQPADGVRNQYLVISLDDIDLYRHLDNRCGKEKSSYTLLEQVYEYLQIPGIIVLATYSARRLKENCVSYITTKFDKFSDPEEQAKQFLEKVILPEYRIFMPRFYMKDYISNRQLQIEVPKSGDKHIFGVQEATRFDQKKLFLKYLSYYYGTYFDSQGQKTHFFEADTLRRIKNRMNVFWLSNSAAKYSLNLNAGELDRRYMKLISYIYNGFSEDVLRDSQEIHLFDRWMRLPIGRRSREIMDYIRSRRRQLDKNESGSVGLNNTRGYSYGELVQDLYWASRARQDGKVILSKEMIHCLLASYSVVLPYWMGFAQKYTKTIVAENPSSRKKKSTQADEEIVKLQEAGYDNIKKVLGTSIAGLWANDILYTVFYEKQVEYTQRRKSGELGSVSTTFFDQIVFGEISFSAEDIESVSESKTCTREQDVKDFVQIAELIGMMFTNVRETKKEEQKYTKKTIYNFVTLAQNEGGTDKVVIVPGVKYACFNIFNFVVNSFCWEDYFEGIDDGLSNVLTQFFEKRIEKDVIRKVIDKYSLLGDFKAWNTKETAGCQRRMAFPVQHFDMAYNILKHQHNGEDQNLPVFAESTDFLKCCADVYQNVINALRQQDKYYKDSSFANTFKTNPFVQYVCDPSGDDFRKKLENRLDKLTAVFLDEIGTLEEYDKAKIYVSQTRENVMFVRNIQENVVDRKNQEPTETEQQQLKRYETNDPSGIFDHKKSQVTDSGKQNTSSIDE